VTPRNVSTTFAKNKHHSSSLKLVTYQKVPIQQARQSFFLALVCDLADRYISERSGWFSG